MAWHVALVLDCDYSIRNLTALTRHMPVWALESPERTSAAPAIRNAVNFWHPEPSLTLFSPASTSGILETILEHHPNTSLLELIDTLPTPQLVTSIAQAGFEPCLHREYPESLAFRRPVEYLSNVPKLYLDASTWKTADDVYNSVFHAVGSPDWHGRNFDALNDSIVTGSINRVEVPYILVLQNRAKIGSGAQQMAADFFTLIGEFASRGCPISIHFAED